MTTHIHSHIPAPLLIAGPPAIGKTFIAKIITQKSNAERVLLTTNKPKRSYEILEEDYNFVSTQEYLDKQKQGLLTISNFYFGYYFGIEKYSIEKIINKGKTPIIEIYTPKIIQLIRLYSRLQAIFLLPESLTLIEQHLTKRGDTPQEQSYLLEESLREIEQFNDYFRYLYNECYILTNSNTKEITTDIIKRYIVQ